MEASSDLNARLGRIETKVDHMSEAIVSLARVEERMVTLFRRTDANDADMKDLAKRVAELERVSFGRGIFFRAFDKVLWVIVGGAIALGVGYLQTKF